MQYLLLIYGEESHWGTLQDADRQKIYKEYMAFTEDIKTSGHYIGCNELQPISTASTVRGYYLVEAKDLDEALALAARIPSVRWGAIEVRPINAH